MSEHVHCVTVAFKVTERVEQQTCIRFCIKLEYSSTETIWMIQKDFRDNAMSAAQIKVWDKHFKDRQESVESDPRSGSPATSRTPKDVECVWATINKYLCEIPRCLL